jgi:hypothetical protein
VSIFKKRKLYYIGVWKLPGIALSQASRNDSGIYQVWLNSSRKFRCKVGHCERSEAILPVTNFPVADKEFYLTTEWHGVFHGVTRSLYQLKPTPNPSGRGELFSVISVFLRVSLCKLFFLCDLCVISLRPLRLMDFFLTTRMVIASEAKQSARSTSNLRDCFVASLLAKTVDASGV